MFNPDEKRDERGRWTADQLRAEAARHGNNAIGNDLRMKADTIAKQEKRKPLNTKFVVAPSKGYIELPLNKAHADFLPSGKGYDRADRGYTNIDYQHQFVEVIYKLRGKRSYVSDSAMRDVEQAIIKKHGLIGNFRFDHSFESE